MGRVTCTYWGCGCKIDLTEVTAEQEAFVCALIEARDGRSDLFKAYIDPQGRRHKTRLCPRHMPQGIEFAELLGKPVARSDEHGVLVFGKVEELAGWSRGTRDIAARVANLLRQPPDAWSYTVVWEGGGSEAMHRSDVAESAALAEAVEKHTSVLLKEAENRRQLEVHAALKRGQRSARTVFHSASRIAAASYGSLLSAMPPSLRPSMPAVDDFERRTHILTTFSHETPMGTIHHSGTGLIFDIKKQNAQTQTHFGRGLCWESMTAEYMRTSAGTKLTRSMFGFRSYDALETFFECTFNMDIDEPGLAHGCKNSLTAFDEYMLALWRMRTHTPTLFIGAFVGLHNPEQRMGDVCNEWIPRLGRAGRSLVWPPSTYYLERSCPPSFKEHGMAKVAYIGDATDILTETVRKEISVRNQQHSDKSKHSAAMGLTWCTPSGWTAMASNLVLGRSSEYNTAVSMAPQFRHLKPDWALCYDKGVASLRAHLPNLNNVVVPCFLSGGIYSAEEAIRNRSIATNRYVIEITYSRVKQWKMLSPTVPREDFCYLNDIWWWALGFCNLSYQPLKRRDEKVSVVQTM